MKRSPRSRKALSLSDSLHKQLNMYALAASAAGVGALALAVPAEAKIVYTPVHVTLQDDKPFPLFDFYLLQSKPKYDSGFSSIAVCRSIGYYSDEVFCVISNTAPTVNAVRVTKSMGGSWGAALRDGAIIQNGDRFLRDTHDVGLGYVNSSDQPTHWGGPLG